ncbi:MAG TPA: hypothetical protein VKT32_02915 [Chthonomonadaceae bacterium]|nr:hypothetical protein [Chthonomonadaceae bacterium]
MNPQALLPCPHCCNALTGTPAACPHCGTPLAWKPARKYRAHRRWIALMWALYLLIPLFSLARLSSGFSFLPLAMGCSLVSFVVALWLVFQRSKADMLNGGLKLLLDAAATIALIVVILHSGALAHLPTLLSGR